MTKPDEREPLLSIQDLHVSFQLENDLAWAVSGVSYDVMPGEFVGVVGESGSGKSVTSLSVMRLIPEPPGHIAKGRVLYKGRDLLQVSRKEMQSVRGREIGMIFQEPMTSLNPVFTIGMQVSETLKAHENYSRKALREAAAEALDRVGIPDPVKRLDDYPHQFSGGMRQRVMIAMALICRPSLLIADEPTTALDVTIQAQILDLMRDLQQEREESSVILITHDLAVIAETCSRVVVMYGGKVQELATIHELFDEPLHPYTRGLMASIPESTKKGVELPAIPGNVPSALNFPKGCKFSTRCTEVMDRCHQEEPELVSIGGRQVRCHLHEEAS